MDWQTDTVLLLLPVIVAAWYGGAILGGIVALLGGIVSDYLFLSTSHHFVPDAAYISAVGSFLVLGVFISVLIQLLRTARIRSEQEKEMSLKHLRRLRESDRRFRRIVESDMIGIIFFKIDGQITDSNDAFLEMLGYKEEDLLAGKLNWKDLTPPEWQRADVHAARQLEEKGVFTPFEKELIAKNGKYIPIYQGGALFEGSKEEGVAYVLNIAQRKNAENMVRHQAFHDALTGLPNRILLKERLIQACNYAKRKQNVCAVLMLDLDRFKVINDSLGHPAGDTLLQEVANRLQNCVREEDTVARFGGDEFVIVANGLQNQKDILKVIEKVFTSLEAPITVAGKQVYINTSIGIAMYPQDGEDEETLIKHADSALYQAKDMGRKTHFFFNDTVLQKEGRSLTMDKELRSALKKGEFVMYYQPIVDVYTKKMVCAESLVRWQHPRRGLLLPQYFISFAEETGLIHELGEWVITEVCQQIRAWQDKGYKPLPITLNISAAQFYRLDFLEKFKEILKHTGVDPHYIVIEITESLAMRHIDTAIAKLTEIREMGITIALDDFGIGHSSLNYLKLLPVDKLKIDKSFVQNSPHDQADTAIVKAIAALAHNLTIRVIAEGVEDEEQLRHLLELKACDEVQGFLLSRPLTGGALQSLLAEGNPFEARIWKKLHFGHTHHL